MEHKDSRNSAIKWYIHYMEMEPDHLIAEYRTILKNDDGSTYPSIERAMENRAPTVKENLDDRFDHEPDDWSDF